MDTELLCTQLAVVLVLAFGVNVWLIQNKHTNLSHSDDPYVDALYFTSTTMSSVGYGDILPVTRTGKLCIAAQQAFTWLLSLGILTVACDLKKVI